MKYVTEQNNFIFFTASLVLMLLLSSLTDLVAEGTAHLMLRGVMFITYAVAFDSLDFGPSWRKFVIVMVLLMLAANGLDEFDVFAGAPLFALIVTLTFFVGVAYTASKRVLFSGTVNLNTIIGALAVYILIGMIWANLYLITLEIYPTAFKGLEAKYWADNWSEAIYFSFITMTSLGYGDISPAMALSRTLASLQVIAGTFYMAIVVASLIGARTTERPNPLK